MKALVTGSLGFVGGYLRAELETNGYEVIGGDLKEAAQTLYCDLLREDIVYDVIKKVRPDVIFHLASQADVSLSWKIPAKTMEMNAVAAVNLLEAVRLYAPNAKIVMVGTSDQYGKLGNDGRSVSENMLTSPSSPYAVSKQAQENISQLYASTYGMSICMTRSFNHGGARQREGFIIADFSAGIARIEKKKQDHLCVGNLESRRDYTHVRDVVRAYRFIAERGKSGEIYNVGSGRTYSGQEILDMLCAMATCEIKVVQDEKRMRPNDSPVICCDHTKLTEDTQWKPQESIRDILQDTLNYYREMM
ncbi:MAG: GDP-mannose 4,6-dehydratase [Clostridia bacterium]|nr:GDP-mannose 4,6-dehydratase [Clostridia bacterium]